MFYIHPYLGKIPILTFFFQMGWNHQLDVFSIEMSMHWFFNGLKMMIRNGPKWLSKRVSCGGMMVMMMIIVFAYFCCCSFNVYQSYGYIMIYLCLYLSTFRWVLNMAKCIFGGAVPLLWGEFLFVGCGFPCGVVNIYTPSN